MEIFEIMPYVRYCTISKYFENDMFRGTTALIPYDSRLFFCLGGTGEIEIDDVIYPMQKGTLIIVKMGTKYRYRHSHKRDMECFSANFDFTYTYSISHQNRIPPDPPNNFKESNLIITPTPFDIINLTSFNEIEKYLFQLKNILYSSSNYKQEEASAIMKLIITKAYGAYEAEEMNDTFEKTELINRVCQYIINNVESINSGTQLSDIFSYHSYYLNRLMVKYKKCTLHRYIINEKIKKAEYYLTSTGLSISEIADKCGFFDSAHFSRKFKSFTGYSPSKYRYL